MNSDKTFSPPTLLTRNRYQVWTWSAIVASILVCILITWMHFKQEQSLRNMSQAISTMHMARIELSRGFVYIALSDDPSSPFNRDEGLVLLRQAASTLETAMRTNPELMDATDLVDFEQSLSVFQARLEEFDPTDTSQSRLATDLRIAFHDLEQRANQVDLQSQQNLQERARQLDSEFVLMLGGAAVLMLGMCGILVFSGKTREQADLALREREQILRDNEARLNTIFEHSPVAIGVSSLENGKITDVNAAFVELYGFNRDEILGRTTADLDIWAIPEDRQRFIDLLQSEKSARNFETVARLGSGIERHVLVSGELVVIDGKPSLMAQIMDITERKQHEEELKLWADIFHNVKWGFVVGGSDGKTLGLMNPAFARMHGYTEQELMGTPIINVFAPECRSELPEQIRLAHEKGQHTFESKHVRRDGTIFPVLVEVVAVKDQAGKILYRVVSVQDITERKLAEEQRAKLIERLDLATRSAHMGIWDWDIQKNEIVWDDQMYALYGLKPGEFGGAYEAWLNGVHPEDREPGNAISAAAVRGEREYDTEFRVLWPDGSVHWLKANGEVFRDEEGTPLRMVGVNYDITERKQMEHILRENERRLHEAQRIAHIGNWDWNLQTGETRWSPENYAIHGLSQDSPTLTPDTLIKFVHPDDLERVNTVISQAISNGTSAELDYRIFRPDGSMRVIHAVGEVTEYDIDGKPSLMLGTNQDITERKQAEEQLRESRELFRKLFDLSPVAYTLVKASDHQIVDVNPACEDIFGYSEAEVVGSRTVDLDYWVDQGELQKATEEFKSNGELRDFEFAYKAKSGNKGWAIAYSNLIQQGGERYILSEFVDITERKQMEEELRRSNSELEQFAYIASHDLQEPLRAVAGMVQLLQKRYQGQLDERADEYIGHAVEAAGRMQALIQALLAYSRVDRRNQSIELVDAGGCLQAALKNLEVSIRENRAVITADALPTVHADPVQLTQLFQNLIGNGIKFRGEKEPHIHITALQSKGAWQFSVRDNGIGIESQYFERIFLVFQRLHTRREYGGTGIGLALCKKIVERHGGSIWVESHPAEGSTFHFTLPIRSMDHE